MAKEVKDRIRVTVDLTTRRSFDSMNKHPFIPFIYQTQDPNGDWDSVWYENVTFTDNFGPLLKDSKWHIVEVRIDGESCPHIYCREKEKEEDGKVIIAEFEISTVKFLQARIYD